MTLSYLWERFWQKLPGAAIRDSKLESPVKIGAQSTVIHTEMGRYSYCGYRCTLIDCRIGRYCSIADGVSAGLAEHPMEWASTSPAFYLGGGGAAPGALAGVSAGGGTVSVSRTTSLYGYWKRRLGWETCSD